MNEIEEYLLNRVTNSEKSPDLGRMLKELSPIATEKIYQHSTNYISKINEISMKNFEIPNNVLLCEDRCHKDKISIEDLNNLEQECEDMTSLFIERENLLFNLSSKLFDIKLCKYKEKTYLKVLMNPQNNNKIGNDIHSNVSAYYKTRFKYTSMQQLEKYSGGKKGDMRGVKRVVAFCCLTVILPAILIICPLYLKHQVFKDLIYAVAESDILEITEGISTIFCQEHALKMNSTFNAFQMKHMPDQSSSRKHIRLKKSMILPDDTLEYWGFYLKKGATVQLKVCSRYDGSKILVVKGERNLRTCGLMDHNKNKFGASFNAEQSQVKVTFETAAEVVNSGEISIKEVSKRLIQEKAVDDESMRNNGGEEIIDYGDEKYKKQNDYANNYLKIDKNAIIPKSSELKGNFEKSQSEVNEESYYLDNRNAASRHNKKQYKLQVDQEELLDEENESEDENLRRSPRDTRLDGGINHGGNAKYPQNESDSISSFENALFECYDGQILVAKGFPPSKICTSVKSLEQGSYLISKHDVKSDGYYYYIFYSDNDYDSNNIHAVFDIYKPTYLYSNISETKGCINSTECRFPIQMFSDEVVIVEVPTRDGIEHEDDDITYLYSQCVPRMAVYVVFPIAVLVFILSLNSMTIRRFYHLNAFSSANNKSIFEDLKKIYQNITSLKSEKCFHVELISGTNLSEDEERKLSWILQDPQDKRLFQTEPFLAITNECQKLIEIGPRFNFSTADSTNSVSICHSIQLISVKRIEVSIRYLFTFNNKHEISQLSETILLDHLGDRMTQCIYTWDNIPVESFDEHLKKDKGSWFVVPLLSEGKKALHDVNSKMGLAFDNWDIDYYMNLFTNILKRNPTNVELFDCAQSNSEHSRHWFFKGRMIIDGEEEEKSLIKMIIETQNHSNKNNTIKFSDNSSAMNGFKHEVLRPTCFIGPGKVKVDIIESDLIFTAETHNMPTAVAPFSGATTGTGGRIRDVQGVGRGGHTIAGTAGYCVGNLQIPGYQLPFETALSHLEYPSSFATPLKIIIEASNGASDYGNKFGEPVIAGFAISYGTLNSVNQRDEYVKPIMFSGGLGIMDSMHTQKLNPERGMLLAKIGGPVYRIGVGGGAASSVEIQGNNQSELDFNAVQRGDAEMENKLNRVVRACIEMGNKNPILAIHDQGAGGNGNVLKELVEPGYAGAIIFSKEFQLDVLGEMPRKKYILERKNSENFLSPLALLPKDDNRYQNYMNRVLSILSVGSKRFLTNKVDRCVSGLVVQQQCVGPLHTPLADYALTCVSHFSRNGIATSIGTQPIKGLINSAAGARMSIAESLSNLVFVKISELADVKCSGNWMWAAKLPGEGAKMVDACKAMCQMMSVLNIAVDGGKDSLSMAARVQNETIKSPGTLVISTYAPCPDVTIRVTPDLKSPSHEKIGELIWINIEGKMRLGGSALAQSFSQQGNNCPDISDHHIESLKGAFNVTQQLLQQKMILAGHDISDGGLLTCLIEMAIGGMCGINVDIKDAVTSLQFDDNDSDHIAATLFAEECGWIVECSQENLQSILKEFQDNHVNVFHIGRSIGFGMNSKIIIRSQDFMFIDETVLDITKKWERTSYELEKLQMNPQCANEEFQSFDTRTGPKYRLTFNPNEVEVKLMNLIVSNPWRVAVIREEGINGDREMIAALIRARFEVHDVTMSDLLARRTFLDNYRGVVFPGGFSYADTLGSAKGWAATILFSDLLKSQFENFKNRKDTFSLGVCNGCQLMSLIGWVGDMAMHYVDDNMNPTEKYPMNPNGSVEGIAALCSIDGRHLAMMPHPERCCQTFQWPYIPNDFDSQQFNPWQSMFNEAYIWCCES
ncbi:CLUMA_CG000196, isoform A [Clunio marinus]|uniref:Phosphoribosylformylglycinamidine synthase n=1 Tax=Clunio marinus TaxID=568069 RepID=A0A1J1HEV2_9DIPT|nr:CLUMA_CG000196, isoform A [Clunio marinus]